MSDALKSKQLRSLADRQDPAVQPHPHPAYPAVCRRARLNQWSRRSGFTLIEILFVAGAVAVLVALLLPAVQHAREAARRTQCKNRLGQISVAFQNYHDAHVVFPPGCVNPSCPVVTNASGLHTSWTVQLLPYLDLGVLELRHNAEVSVYALENADVRKASLPVLRCPSNVGNESTTPYSQFPISNYAGVTGGSDVVIDEDNTGLLFLNSSVNPIHIGDGCSNQLAVGERQWRDIPSKNDLGWMSGTSATLRNGGTSINLVETEDAYPQSYINLDETTGGFSSAHNGGAPFALADGSVRFMSENIDMTLFRRLCDINDGYDQSEF